MGYKLNSKSTNQKIFRDSQRIKNKTVRYQAKENMKINKLVKSCSEDKNMAYPYTCEYLSYNSQCICYHWQLSKRILDKMPGYQSDFPSTINMKIKKKIFAIPEILNVKKCRRPTAKNRKVPSLPGPVWIIIFSFCSLRTMMSLEMVSKIFQKLVNLAFNEALDPNCCCICNWPGWALKYRISFCYCLCHATSSSLLQNISNSINISPQIFLQMKTLFIQKKTYWLQKKHMKLIKRSIDKYKELSFWEYPCVICEIPQMKKSYDIIKGILSYKDSINKEKTSKESAMCDSMQELVDTLLWLHFKNKWSKFLDYFR